MAAVTDLLDSPRFGSLLTAQVLTAGKLHPNCRRNRRIGRSENFSPSCTDRFCTNRAGSHAKSIHPLLLTADRQRRQGNFDNDQLTSQPPALDIST